MKIKAIARKGCPPRAVQVTFTEADMMTLSAVLSEAARTGMSDLDKDGDRRYCAMVLRLAGVADGFTAGEGCEVSWLERMISGDKSPHAAAAYVKGRVLVDESYDPAEATA